MTSEIHTPKFSPCMWMGLHRYYTHFFSSITYSGMQKVLDTTLLIYHRQDQHDRIRMTARAKVKCIT